MLLLWTGGAKVSSMQYALIFSNLQLILAPMGIDVEEAKGAWRASITASATQHHGWSPQTPMSSGREALPSRICAAGVADAMIMTYTCAVCYHPDDAVGIHHSTSVGF